MFNIYSRSAAKLFIHQFGVCIHAFALLICLMVRSESSMCAVCQVSRLISTWQGEEGVTRCSKLRFHTLSAGVLIIKQQKLKLYKLTAQTTNRQTCFNCWTVGGQRVTKSKCLVNFMSCSSFHSCCLQGEQKGENQQSIFSPSHGGSVRLSQGPLSFILPYDTIRCSKCQIRTDIHASTSSAFCQGAVV